jgi:teichuronic acid biosynthesis glycosyltransferase TuaH
MIKPDYDLIILALPRWDGLYSSTAYSLAKELSRHTRVFYVDNPFTLKDYISQGKTENILKRRNALLYGTDAFAIPDPAFPDLITVTPRLVLPINWLPPGKIYNFLSHRNDGIIFQVFEQLIKKYAVKRFVFINSFNPLFGKYFPKRFKPALRLYHCVDDISKSEYISKHGTYLESEMVKKADLTLVTSMELKKLKSKESPEVYYHPNAADVELFQKALGNLPKPVEMITVPEASKVIFYMGNICHRLDYELLQKIVLNNPDKYLVMVGPRTNDNYKKAGLDRQSNVIFTGRKNLEELPAFIKYSHCCIIPFLCIPLTKSIYPLKINEYLSAGKPVVTTNFSEDIAKFAGIAQVSASHEDFLLNIDKAIATDSPEKAAERTRYAAGNNWKARAIELIEIVNSKIKNYGE